MLMTGENVPEYIYLSYENNMTRRREIPTTVSGCGVVSVELREDHDLQTFPKQMSKDTTPQGLRII